MKLARINHIRCGEATYNYTYVWVDENLSDDEIKVAVKRAQDAYMVDLQAYKQAGENPPNRAGQWSKPQYENYPNLTVAEIDALHDKERKEYKAWEQKRRDALKSFKRYLADEDIIPVQEFEPDLTLEVNWGHNHGVPIEYDTTEDNDIRGGAYDPDDDDW